MPQQKKDSLYHQPGIFKDESMPGVVTFLLYDLQGQWMATSHIRSIDADAETEEDVKQYYVRRVRSDDPGGVHFPLLRRLA